MKRTHGSHGGGPPHDFEGTLQANDITQQQRDEEAGFWMNYARWLHDGLRGREPRMPEWLRRALAAHKFRNDPKFRGYPLAFAQQRAQEEAKEEVVQQLERTPLAQFIPPRVPSAHDEWKAYQRNVVFHATHGARNFTPAIRMPSWAAAYDAAVNEDDLTHGIQRMGLEEESRHVSSRSRRTG